jgi:SAM-dependent methyltransferase
VTAAARRRALMLRHRGDAVRCPICGHGFDAFAPAWNRGYALCWRCGSHERHRALWMLLQARPAMLSRARALLHFAPEYCLRRVLDEAGRRDGFRYDTADLDPHGVDMQLDITRMTLPDAAYDAVICSHVLEHVDDDGAAMRELHRVTAPGGWCLVMVPLDTEREASYEDASIVTPEARREAFLQDDHVRLYGRDVEDRLQAAGFGVEVLRPRDSFGEPAMLRAGLLPGDWMYVCERPGRS